MDLALHIESLVCQLVIRDTPYIRHLNVWHRYRVCHNNGPLHIVSISKYRYDTYHALAQRARKIEVLNTKLLCNSPNFSKFVWIFISTSTNLWVIFGRTFDRFRKVWIIAQLLPNKKLLPNETVGDPQRLFVMRVMISRNLGSYKFCVFPVAICFSNQHFLKFFGNRSHASCWASWLPVGEPGHGSCPSLKRMVLLQDVPQ